MMRPMVDKGGRRKSEKETKAIPVNGTPKLLEYLDELVDMEGFGNSRAEVARNFVWQEVNRLIAVGRLKAR
jgi:hypothetical protein